MAAIGPSGNSAYSNVADVPSSPTGLGATAVSTSQINLTWTNNAASDAILIEMSTDDVNFRQIATLAANATTYSSTGLQTGIRYYYRVRAQDIYFGLSAYSNMASAITFGPPAAPTNLVATVCAFSQINLRWQDNSSNETNFLVMRSTDNKNWSQIGFRRRERHNLREHWPESEYHLLLQGCRDQPVWCFGRIKRCVGDDVLVVVLTPIQ